MRSWFSFSPKPYQQLGGGTCSICKSEGTTKVTCPCNPQASNPNYEKHYNWQNVCPNVKTADVTTDVQTKVKLPQVKVPHI